MLFLAAESTTERVFIHTAPLMLFTESLYKSAIILLILNTNFRNLVVS